MAQTIFKDFRQSLDQLIGDIDRGKLALPDIQRPFVWKKSEVRDLLDSMYRGFPIGYLMIWNTSDTTHKSIGISEKEFSPNSMIIDGQQRLTSLYAVMRGSEVVFENFSRGRIRIAFRPRDAKFDVTDAAIEKDPEYLADISPLWTGKNYLVVNEFIERLKQHNPDEVDDEVEEDLRKALGELTGLKDFPFQGVEIGAEIDEEQVAEIFLRVNSGGQRLKQADFILTLLSVFREDDRRRLERFAEDAVIGSTGGKASAFNHLIEPKPDQLLRAAILLGFRRGSLKSVLALLRGADPDGQELEESQRTAHLNTLEDAITKTLDLTNWHEFLKVTTIAGFRRSQEISSNNVIIYSYGIYLIGRITYGLSFAELRLPIARFFFMTALTGRYSGSSETQVTTDVQTLTEASDKDGFVKRLEGLIDAELTPDFWATTLPERLSTSSPRSPGLFAYAASLNLLDARVPPFGPSSAGGRGVAAIRMKDLMDPGISPKKQALERHHLFPRAYLEREGIKSNTKINQIANLAYVEWPENIKIADNSPSDYWPPLEKNFTTDDRSNHALPDGWHLMEYEEFLDARRQLIAVVIEKGFNTIGGAIESDELITDTTESVPPAGTVPTPAPVDETRAGRILQRLEGVVTWVDHSISAIELNLLRGELDLDQVSEIRLVSIEYRPEELPISAFRAFYDEMLDKGIDVEWRLLAADPSGIPTAGLIADDDQTFEIPRIGAEPESDRPKTEESDLPVDDLNTIWEDNATSLGPELRDDGLLHRR